MSKQVRITAFNCPNCGAAVAPESPSCRYCGSPIAARVCPACYGAVSIGMKHCPHCGAAVTGAAPEKAGSLLCPRCRTNLAPVSVGRHSLNTCSGCGGLWVDKDSFQSICTQQEEQEAVLRFRSESAEPPAPLRGKPRRTYIPCPECGNLMNHKNFSGCSGVVLDWCRNHGSWFDRQELQRIVAFIRGGGLREAREREKRRLKEQESRSRMQELTNASLFRRRDPTLSGMLENQMKGTDPLLKFLSSLFK